MGILITLYSQYIPVVYFEELDIYRGHMLDPIYFSIPWIFADMGWELPVNTTVYNSVKWTQDHKIYRQNIGTNVTYQINWVHQK